MVANRLRKNMRNLSRWLRNENIHCYRLYDADIPEYAVAVDIYEPRSFGRCGPAGCNHCGGIVSELLVQILAAEGIRLPRGVAAGFKTGPTCEILSVSGH